MFGPEKFGYTKRACLIFNHHGKNVSKQKDPFYKQGGDGISHLYRLTVNPDNTVEVHIVQKEFYKGCVKNVEERGIDKRSRNSEIMEARLNGRVAVTAKDLEQLRVEHEFVSRHSREVARDSADFRRTGTTSVDITRSAGYRKSRHLTSADLEEDLIVRCHRFSSSEFVNDERRSVCQRCSLPLCMFTLTCVQAW